MERLTYWCDNGMGDGEWRVNVKGGEESGAHVDRLAAIEDILGDTYDLSRLRELLEVCKGKTPDQVAGIFEEWSHYLKFSAEKNAIEGALNSIYQGGEADYGRLRELVEADREGRCVVLPCKLGSIVQFRGNPNVEKQKVDCISFYADGKITFGFHEYGMKTTWVDEWGEDDAENYTEVKEATESDK